jgi:hypothetical protein
MENIGKILYKYAGAALLVLIALCFGCCKGGCDSCVMAVQNTMDVTCTVTIVGNSNFQLPSGEVAFVEIPSGERVSVSAIRVSPDANFYEEYECDGYCDVIRVIIH